MMAVLRSLWGADGTAPNNSLCLPSNATCVHPHFIFSSASQLNCAFNTFISSVVGASDETALADVALNILCLLMKRQWSWLCTENIQKTIRLLFGTLINR